MLTVHKCCDIWLFRHLSNPAFCGLEFQKQVNSDGDLVFESISKFMYISEMQKKIGQIFFHFEITGFELIPLDTRFYWERIFLIGCQYVNK